MINSTERPPGAVFSASAALLIKEAGRARDGDA